MDDNGEASTVGRIVEWVRRRLRRSIFMTLGLNLTESPVNPLKVLGMLTFTCFLILGVTGVLLQLYYQPDFVNSYDSVARITDQIAYGFEIKNIHYHTSNLMIVLAVVHLFYLFFSKKYRYNNELIWVTGMIAGVLTLADAYTGYVLVMNTRAMLAINIGSGIVGSISPDLSLLLFGSSYTDLVLRMQTFHSILIPAVILFLILFHFPRSLKLDWPSTIGLFGIVLILSGLAPSALGTKFMASAPTEITIPEWYLSGIYALLRTGAPVFLAGLLLPFIYALVLTIIPFYDRESERNRRRETFILVAGLTSIAYALWATVWGLRGGGLIGPINSESDLAISPLIFYSSLAVIFVVILCTVMLYAHGRAQPQKKETDDLQNATSLSLGANAARSRLAFAALTLVVAVQVILAVQSLYAGLQGLRELALIESGLVMLGLALAIHIARVVDST